MAHQGGKTKHWQQHQHDSEPPRRLRTFATIIYISIMPEPIAAFSFSNLGTTLRVDVAVDGVVRPQRCPLATRYTYELLMYVAFQVSSDG